MEMIMKRCVNRQLDKKSLRCFLSFKAPNKENLYAKFQLITRNDNKFQSLLNMINQFSHTIEILSATDTSDFSYTFGRKGN